MIDLTPIFQALILLLAALITYKLIPWIKARTTDAQQANLTAMAKIAVYAAEQLYGAGQGDKKLEYARKALISAGFDVDTDVLRAAIESAVYNMPVFTVYEAGTEPLEDEPAEVAPGIVEQPPDVGGENHAEE